MSLISPALLIWNTSWDRADSKHVTCPARPAGSWRRWWGRPRRSGDHWEAAARTCSPIGCCDVGRIWSSAGFWPRRRVCEPESWRSLSLDLSSAHGHRHKQRVAEGGGSHRHEYKAASLSTCFSEGVWCILMTFNVWWRGHHRWDTMLVSSTCPGLYIR